MDEGRRGGGGSGWIGRRREGERCLVYETQCMGEKGCC